MTYNSRDKPGNIIDSIVPASKQSSQIITHGILLDYKDLLLSLGNSSPFSTLLRSEFSLKPYTLQNGVNTLQSERYVEVNLYMPLVMAKKNLKWKLCPSNFLHQIIGSSWDVLWRAKHNNLLSYMLYSFSLPITVPLLYFPSLQMLLIPAIREQILTVVEVKQYAENFK